MLTIAFKKAGFEVLSATHASEAMEILALETVDVVLSDVLLNALSGHDLARWVAANRQAVPCVLMTGCDDTDCDDCPFASRCVQLRKPLEIREAIGIVAQAMRASGE